MGFQTTGTASEYFAVDASKVTPIPKEMSYEEGAMIEPLAVAVHGVKQMGDAGFGCDRFHASLEQDRLEISWHRQQKEWGQRK